MLRVALKPSGPALEPLVMPLLGAPDHHAVGWRDPIKDWEIGGYMQKNGTYTREGEDDIAGNVVVGAILLVPGLSLA